MEPGRINVNGEGIASGEPDICNLTVTTKTFNQQSNLSRKANNIRLNECRIILREKFGIESKDLKTFGLSVRPEYDSSKTAFKSGRTHKVVGYHVLHNLSVCIRNLEHVDDIIDAISGVGDEVAIGNVAFDIDDKSALYDTARRAAFQNARQKAQLYCEQAGVGLDSLQELNEHAHYGNGIRAARAEMACAQMGGAPDDSSGIETGELDVTINIDCVFNISPRLPK